MKCVICYGNTDIASMRRIADELVGDLERSGIDYVRVSQGGLVIDTPHVHVTITNDVNKFKGRRFDEIFGDVPSSVAAGRLKDPESERFRGTLLDYILQEEGITRIG